MGGAYVSLFRVSSLLPGQFMLFAKFMLPEGGRTGMKLTFFSKAALPLAGPWLELRTRPRPDKVDANLSNCSLIVSYSGMAD